MNKIWCIKLIRRIRKAEIFKVFSFTASATLVKMLSSFILVKVLAVVIGPSGVALLGQLSNFSSVVLTLGSGGINSGVTKYIAEYRGDSEKVSKILSTSTKISLTLSLSIGLVLVLFSTSLSSLVLKSPDFNLVFIIFGFTLVFYTLNNQLLSILNGYKEFRKYVSINIFSSIFGLLFTGSMVLLWSLKGALIASVTYQSVTFFISLILVLKSPWFTKDLILNDFNWIFSKKLFGYSLMTLVSASTVPVAQILVRGLLTDKLSLNDAGIWEGMNRISGMYLMVITSALTVYYLPKLSETLNTYSLRIEVIRVYKFITPVLIVSICSILVLKHFIISLLFTGEFTKMNELFIFQLTGDFFKMMAWVLSFIMIAKAMTFMYIITEVTFVSSFVTLAFYFITKLGFIGASVAYMVNYFLYFLLMLVLFRQLIFSNKIHKISDENGKKG